MEKCTDHRPRPNLKLVHSTMNGICTDPIGVPAELSLRYWSTMQITIGVTGQAVEAELGVDIADNGHVDAEGRRGQRVEQTIALHHLVKQRTRLA